MFRLLGSRLFAICLAVIGIFMIYTGHRSAVKFAALRDHGKMARAEVVKLEWKEKKMTHSDSLYTAHVRFHTEDGREVQAEVGVPAELGRSLRGNATAATMNVRYLPESPSTIEDVNKDDPSEAQSGIGRIMLFLGIGMLVVRLLFSKRRAR
ncbi:DUF3592 domain-containing protein [Piscinibacter terrae]|uniref:DUF3592 domain-containing protein n=1 Tax=Piscinibacter terrae TaxID=2496871 RepID=A0A3N7HJQ2_9BURK|nr:DUF3592 domain-containing protein [Albitalea terrae]RQP22294.1 DUF3592 domain-containing protein [Albitalea terrae]